MTMIVQEAKSRRAAEIETRVEAEQEDDRIPDLDRIEDMPDEALTESFRASDPIAVTFATGMYESDLLGSLERARRLAGEVC